MRAQYDMRKRWIGNQRGKRMSSTGMVGTRSQGSSPNWASKMRVNTLTLAAPPLASDRGARFGHVRRLRIVADHLEAEIGLHRRADVEGSIMKQRPSTMCALDAAQINADLVLELGRVRLTEVLPQQNILGRNRRVGFEFEYPMPVIALLTYQCIGRAVDSAVDFAQVSFLDHLPANASLDATSPERSAPSIVAGSPVFVQSPARKRLIQDERAGGRRAS